MLRVPPKQSVSAPACRLSRCLCLWPHGVLSSSHSSAGEQVTCEKCGALILQATADKTGGVYMPCKKGMRESIEAAKLYYQRERELDRTDPLRRLWRELVDRVHLTEPGYAGLSDAGKKYFAVQLLVREVYNGGFEQYFHNSSGSYYGDAEIGLEEMGATQSLSLLRRVRHLIFGIAPVPEETRQRREILWQQPYESYSGRLDELDHLFCQDPDGLDDRTEAFAKQHRIV